MARREQSTKILRQKLLNRNYDEAEVDAAIEQLTKNKYLNDEETCANQFENLYAAEILSVRQICAKLIQRGFDSDFVKSLIPDDTHAHEMNAAAKAVAKKFSGKIPAEADALTLAKFKNKIRLHLSSKGFSSEIIGAAVEDFLNVDGH